MSEQVVAEPGAVSQVVQKAVSWEVLKAVSLEVLKVVSWEVRNALEGRMGVSLGEHEAVAAPTHLLAPKHHLGPKLPLERRNQLDPTLVVVVVVLLLLQIVGELPVQLVGPI